MDDGRYAEGRTGYIRLRALEEFARRCGDDGHQRCNGHGLCVHVLESERAQRVLDADARIYDVGRIVREQGQGEPSMHWRTAALFRMVSDRVMVPPWVGDAFQRTVYITSALARLGERGVPPDALMRTYLGPQIKRRILLVVAAVKSSIAEGVLAEEAVPWQLEGWLSLLDDSRHHQRGGMAISVLTGPVNAQLDEWLKTAAMAHLIDWRLESFKVDLRPEDLVLSAGVDATAWVADRFIHTGLDAWKQTSLDWELAYLEDHAGVAERADLPMSMLAERPVSREMLLAAIRRRVCDGQVDGPVLMGMSGAEVNEHLISMASGGDVEGALCVARRAVQEVPDHPKLCNALAFLMIPFDVLDAERRFRALLADRRIPADVLHANIASCQIREGRMAEAVETAYSLLGMDCVAAAWLWEPASLVPGGSPAVTEMTIRAWAERVLVVCGVEPDSCLRVSLDQTDP